MWLRLLDHTKPTLENDHTNHPSSLTDQSHECVQALAQFSLHFNISPLIIELRIGLPKQLVNILKFEADGKAHKFHLQNHPVQRRLT